MRKAERAPAPLHRKKTKACALALKERAKHTNSRIAIMDACCTNTISGLEGVRCPLPPSRPRDPFQKDSEYNEHPQWRNPHRVHTLLGSCPPPVTGVNLHVYPLIRAGICCFSFLSPFPSCFFFPLFTRVALFSLFLFFCSLGFFLSIPSSNLLLVSAIGNNFVSRIIQDRRVGSHDFYFGINFPLRIVIFVSREKEFR